jgi:hypothetical protein
MRIRFGCTHMASPIDTRNKGSVVRISLYFPLFVMGPFRGQAASWHRPVFVCGIGWQSSLTLTTGQRISISTDTAEDHVWITEPGEPVEIGLNGAVHLMADEEEEEEEEEGNFVPCRLYVNLPALRIVGIKRQCSLLDVSLQDGRHVVCAAEEEKGRELLDAGVGAVVQLYNVTQFRGGGMHVTSKSGVRVLKEKREEAKRCRTPSPPPRAAPPRGRQPRWNCLMCGWLNYPSAGSCRICKRTRRLGPMHLTFFNWPSEMWCCRQCAFETNAWNSKECEWCAEPRWKRKRRKKQ